METMTITEKEKGLLSAIYNSEFNDATHTAWVYVDCLWGYCDKRMHGGVMASLKKKGLVSSDGECCRLTDNGLKVTEKYEK